jgi:hypothetical protein
LCYPGLGFTLSSAKSNGHEKSNGTGLVKLQIFQNQMDDHVADSKMMERDLKGEWQFLPNRAMLGTVSKCEVEVSKILVRLSFSFAIMYDHLSLCSQANQ